MYDVSAQGVDERMIKLMYIIIVINADSIVCVMYINRIVCAFNVDSIVYIMYTK